MPVPPPRSRRHSPGLCGAYDLARAYDASVAACWRGEADGCAFEAWLAGYRCVALAPPAGPAAAVSPHGAGGRSIAWYDAAGAILGCVPGASWGYRVPRAAMPPTPSADGRRTATIGRVHPDEVETVLHHQHVGRLACLAGGRPYVVPIAYAYAGGDIYGHSFPGRKLAALRADPHVCFEVDEREDGETWCSVVADGVYEELADATERQAALALLQGTELAVLPATVGATGVVFRLRLTDKSGRVVLRGS